MSNRIANDFDLKCQLSTNVSNVIKSNTYIIPRCIQFSSDNPTRLSIVFSVFNFSRKTFASDRLNNGVCSIFCSCWHLGRWRCFHFPSFPCSTVICCQPPIIYPLVFTFQRNTDDGNTMKTSHTTRADGKRTGEKERRMGWQQCKRNWGHVMCNLNRIWRNDHVRHKRMPFSCCWICKSVKGNVGFFGDGKVSATRASRKEDNEIWNPLIRYFG